MASRKSDLYPGTGNVGDSGETTFDGTVPDNPVADVLKAVLTVATPIFEVAHDEGIDIIIITFRPSVEVPGRFDQIMSTTCQNPEIMAARLSQSLERILDPDTFRDVMQKFAKWESEQHGHGGEDG